MDSTVTAMRKHIAARRAVIADRWPKNLPHDEYTKTVGMHEELEAFAGALSEHVKKMNAADGDTESP